MMFSKLLTSSFLLCLCFVSHFIFPSKLLAEDVVFFEPQTNVMNVVAASRSFLLLNKIDVDHHKVKSVRYNYITRNWFVSYETPSLAIGEGFYSVRISDIDKADIEFFKGL